MFYLDLHPDDPSASLLTMNEVESLCRQRSLNEDPRTALGLLREVITDHAWASGSEDTQVLKPVLMRLCARYLYREKRRGYALDSVGTY